MPLGGLLIRICKCLKGAFGPGQASLAIFCKPSRTCGVISQGDPLKYWHTHSETIAKATISGWGIDPKALPTLVVIEYAPGKRPE